jgi:uncharacterized membrane protein YkvA (DUF1232 family)
VVLDLKAMRERVRQVKVDLIALSLAARDARTPWYAKLVVAACVAYALSPIDVIPDFIPVLGLVDDLIFIPIALALAVRFIPEEVLADCRRRAGEIAERRSSRAAAIVIIAFWVLLAAVGVWLVLQ